MLVPMANSVWLELKIEVPFEFVEPMAELFKCYGKGGVAIEEAGGWNPDEGESAPERQSAILRTYMPKTARYERRRELIHIGVALINKITTLPPLKEREIAEKEWENAWKAHFTPLRVGSHLVVQPPWHRSSENQSGDLIIEIDPGLAFGTGHHPTTYRALEWAERLVEPGMDVIDIGAGSAILSIGAARMGAKSVVGIEIDPVAIKAGRANVRANRLSRVVKLFEGSLPHSSLVPESADVVLANVNSVVLTNLAPEIAKLMRPNGFLVAAGILEERLTRLESAFQQAGLGIVDRIEDDDWRALVCKIA